MTVKALMAALVLTQAVTLADSFCCDTIDASITIDGTIYLVSGDEMMELDSLRREKRVDKLSDKFTNLPGPIDAAAVWPPNNHLPYFFVGQNNYVVQSSQPDTFEGPYSNTDWSPFVAGGLDAVAFAGNVLHFFRRCNYQTRDKDSFTYSTVKNLSALGLPCNLDSALTINGKLIAIKNGRFWRYSGSGRAKGPRRLSKLFEVTSWKFCPWR